MESRPIQSTTSRPNQSALPETWIDRLFARFATMYGKHWLDLWAGIPMEQVRQTWQEDLSAFSGEQIRRALDYCRRYNKFPPTCPEFVNLCWQFRREKERVLYLAAPRGEIPDNVKKAIDEMFKRPS